MLTSALNTAIFSSCIYSQKLKDTLTIMKLTIFIALALFIVAGAIEEDTGVDQDEQKDDLIANKDISLPEDDPSHKHHYPCHKRCGTGIYHAAGKCNYKTGRCDCVYGYTGTHSRYMKGYYPINAISADHCTQPCHYTHDYRNPHCVYAKYYRGYGYKNHITYPTHIGDLGKKPYSNHYDEYNCHWKCGFGSYHEAGKCVGRNKCLCWWGWTGPGAKYIHSGYYKNRIIANYCTKPCHYTHDYRNRKCGYFHKY